MLLIQKFLLENYENWEEVLNSKGIKVKRKDNLAILSYNLNEAIENGIKLDFADPIVKECRGIIVDTMDNFRVVCYPFSKFGNYTESYADDIDWSTAKVQEKLDGSLIKLYFYDGKWRWATNGMIDANDAMASNGETFYELIQKAVNINDLDYNRLSTNCTYMFELVSPYNRVVVRYDYPMLYHIGTRNNVYGNEFWQYVGVVQPKEYKLSSLDDCIVYAELLNPKGICEHEGFVVVDRNYHRVKVKSIAYLTLHKSIDNHGITDERAIEIIQQKMTEQYYSFPREYAKLKEFEYKISTLRRDLFEYLVFAINLWEEYEHEKKAFALQIKDDKFKDFAFNIIKQPECDVLEFVDNWLKNSKPRDILKRLNYV